MTKALVETLKRTLKSRGMTYAELARALHVSTPTVKRLFSERSFSLERVEDILRVLDMDFLELARLSQPRDAGPAQLSQEQETALAKDPKLFSIFWLLCNDFRFEAIRGDFAIGAAELTAHFARLDKLGLVEWRPGNQVRLRVPKQYVWRPGGPLRKAYGLKVVTEFMRSRFDAPSDGFHFEAQALSPESALVVKRKLDKLAAEIRELVEMDAASPGARRVTMGVLLACRPWNISIVDALRAGTDGLQRGGLQKGTRA